MNPWLIAAIALACGYVLCGIVIVRGRLMERLVASQMTGLLTILELEILAQAFGAAFFIDLALTFALLSFPAGIVFAYFYGRWL